MSAETIRPIRYTDLLPSLPKETSYYIETDDAGLLERNLESLDAVYRGYDQTLRGLTQDAEAVRRERDRLARVIYEGRLKLEHIRLDIPVAQPLAVSSIDEADKAGRADEFRYVRVESDPTDAGRFRVVNCLTGGIIEHGLKRGSAMAMARFWDASIAETRPAARVRRRLRRAWQSVRAWKF